MPHPNMHDQPAEGGEKEVEGALQKQQKTSPEPRRDKQKDKPDDPELNRK